LLRVDSQLFKMFHVNVANNGRKKLYFSIPLHCLCHKYTHCLPS
jgi:hypothetical protein